MKPLSHKTFTITLPVVEVQEANLKAGIPGCLVLETIYSGELNLFDNGELKDDDWRLIAHVKPECPISWRDVLDGHNLKMIGHLSEAIKFAKDNTGYKYVAWSGRIYGTEPNKEITPWTVENL